MGHHEDAALSPSATKESLGEGEHHSSIATQHPKTQPNSHTTGRGRSDSDLERAIPPPASTLGMGPPCSEPSRRGHPRREERDPQCDITGRPRCRPAEPGERDPPAPGTSPREPRVARGHLPKEVPAVRRARARRLGRGCPGSGEKRGAPGVPARGEGTAGLPRAARLSGDGAIRRYGGRRSQTGRILTCSLCLGHPRGAAGRLSAPAGGSRCHPSFCSPPKGRHRQRENVPKPIRGVPAHPSGSQRVQGARKWMLEGADPWRVTLNPPRDARRAGGAGTAAAQGHHGDALARNQHDDTGGDSPKSAVPVPQHSQSQRRSRLSPPAAAPAPSRSGAASGRRLCRPAKARSRPNYSKSQADLELGRKNNR